MEAGTWGSRVCLSEDDPGEKPPAPLPMTLAEQKGSERQLGREVEVSVEGNGTRLIRFEF